MINTKKTRSLIEHFYAITTVISQIITSLLRIYFGRILRFLAIPYCFTFLVNWEECNKSKIIVLYDLLYIFIKHKRFPDNYSLCRLWEKPRNYWKYYYGSNYDVYQKRALNFKIQPDKYKIIFDDKEVAQMCCDAAGIPLPKFYGSIDICDDYKKMLYNIASLSNEIIVKPVLGSGGKGIVKVVKVGGEIIVYDKCICTPLCDFTLKSRSIVQEYLVQNKILSKMSQAFSTVRVVTLIKSDHTVLIVGAFIRFGRNGSYVDNLSSGGLAVGVEISSGKLKKWGSDNTSKVYSSHPDNGELFDGFEVPRWNEVLELAVKTQQYFSFYRLLGLDIGITSEGVVLIEINPSHDNNSLEQTFGPILLNTEILREFHNNGLLINDAQKSLMH